MWSFFARDRTTTARRSAVSRMAKAKTRYEYRVRGAKTTNRRVRGYATAYGAGGRRVNWRQNRVTIRAYFATPYGTRKRTRIRRAWPSSPSVCVHARTRVRRRFPRSLIKNRARIILCTRITRGQHPNFPAFVPACTRI